MARHIAQTTNNRLQTLYTQLTDIQAEGMQKDVNVAYPLMSTLRRHPSLLSRDYVFMDDITHVLHEGRLLDVIAVECNSREEAPHALIVVVEEESGGVGVNGGHTRHTTKPARSFLALRREEVGEVSEEFVQEEGEDLVPV